MFGSPIVFNPVDATLMAIIIRYAREEADTKCATCEWARAEMADEDAESDVKESDAEDDQSCESAMALDDVVALHDVRLAPVYIAPSWRLQQLQRFSSVDFGSTRLNEALVWPGSKETHHSSHLCDTSRSHTC